MPTAFFAKARRQALSNVAAMRESALPTIATSSTCTFTLRDEYPHVLDIDNSDVRDRVELATRWDLAPA
nr:Anaerobic glycerol-3-phosphate dehydrogenase subunit C [Raoultella sp. NCTC 9187]